MRQKPPPKTTYNMKIQQIHQILKKQQERRLRQTVYTWGNQQTSRKREKYQSCGPVGPKPFLHPNSLEGGIEMEWEGGVEAKDC